MAGLKLDLWTFDVGAAATGPEEYVELVSSRVLNSWNDGADLVVFPEFTWMGLERFVHGPDKVAGVADLFWKQLWPDLSGMLMRTDKAVVLGTVPFLTDDGRMANRAPILSNGKFIHQDKIHLTPWEDVFSGGGPLRIWTFRGFRIAVVICLDIEVPEIAVALREHRPDLLLVPSATENLLGVERVGRCADARAVELGCHVGLCHLTGVTRSVLVDENIGKLAFFSPSQSPFLELDRSVVSGLFREGCHKLSISVEMGPLNEIRALTGETDPSKLRPDKVAVVISD